MTMIKGQNDVLWALGKQFFSLCFVILIYVLLYIQLVIYKMQDRERGGRLW